MRLVAARREDELTTIFVGDELFVAVALESQLRSQDIPVQRIDTHLEAPAPVGREQYRLVVRTEDLPSVLEMLDELADGGPPLYSLR